MGCPASVVVVVVVGGTVVVVLEVVVVGGTVVVLVVVVVAVVDGAVVEVSCALSPPHPAATRTITPTMIHRRVGLAIDTSAVGAPPIYLTRSVKKVRCARLVG
jgi:hypothetical protein